VFPHLFRRVRGVAYRRERIDTPDGDFLDLDWSCANGQSVQDGTGRLAVLAHGLEGDSNRGYVRGMARALNRAGWDAVAWNLRGCGGEPNRTARLYHSGATEDLHAVLGHVASAGRHRSAALVGFSLGGNITLKYLGERGLDFPLPIEGAVAISVPCDLTDSSVRMEADDCRPYMARFLRSLHRKIRLKRHRFPDLLDDTGYRRIRTFREFDDRYTAPLHGFRDADDYWRRCSSRQFLAGLRVPTLLVNARNDPFLAGGCYPVAEAESNPSLFLEMPAGGGHVGFAAFGHDGLYWSEARAVEFLSNHHPDCTTALS
jgi:predicted alpha/beta-fold hydrolase